MSSFSYTLGRINAHISMLGLIVIIITAGIYGMLRRYQVLTLEDIVLF